ncbi:MAG: phosphatase PAP2 family protein [Anaplasmataceae bacterium]|nr:phosphatase PAP2 family protein [Anaplasmataceae bacterium]
MGHNLTLHDRELEWIHKLQQGLRTPFTDYFFIGWNYVDTLGFSMFLVSLVWYLINRRVGIRLLYILILSSVINSILKNYFGSPRPCQIDPSVGLLCLSSCGFPSGAAQTAIILASVVVIECRRRLYWYLGYTFAFFLCFSRIYLGVHYFSDILGGVIVGGVLSLIYWKLFPLMERIWKLSAFLFPILLLCIQQSSSLYFFGVSLGVAIGLLSSEKRQCPREPRTKMRCIQALSIVSGLFALYASTILYPTLTVLWAFTSGLWISYLGPWIFQKCMKKPFKP